MRKYKKSKEKSKRDKKQSNAPTKGCIESLSEYFGSYLNALELVRARQ